MSIATITNDGWKTTRSHAKGAQISSGSFTWATPSPRAQPRWTRAFRVESHLRFVASDSGPEIEVINSGTSGYSPVLYYLLLRHRLLEYDPDWIVVNIDMTAVLDNWKYSQILVLDDAGNPLQGRGSSPAGPRAERPLALGPEYV